jgi:PHD/YefM family antitoxin component YafN of YafNO toxin-antitoxin module
MLIPTRKNIKTITDMREDALGLLKTVEKQGLTYIFHHSRPRAVMFSLDDFIKLQELLENYLDGQEAEELAKKPRGKGKKLAAIIDRYV